MSVVQSDLLHKDIFVASLMFWDYNYIILPFSFLLPSPPIGSSFPSFKFLDSLLINRCYMHIWTCIYIFIKHPAFDCSLHTALPCLSCSSLSSQVVPLLILSCFVSLFFQFGFYFVCTCECGIYAHVQVFRGKPEEDITCPALSSSPVPLSQGLSLNPELDLWPESPRSSTRKHPRARLRGTWD